MARYFIYKSELEDVADTIRDKLEEVGQTVPSTGFRFPIDFITEIGHIHFAISDIYINNVYPLTDINENDPTIIYEKDIPTLEEIQPITATNNGGIFQIKWSPDRTKVAVVLRPEYNSTTYEIDNTTWSIPGIYIYDITTRPFTLCTKEILDADNIDTTLNTLYDNFVPASGEPIQRPIACDWLDTGELLIMTAYFYNSGSSAWIAGTYGTRFYKFNYDATELKWKASRVWQKIESGADSDCFRQDRGTAFVPTFFESAYIANPNPGSDPYTILLVGGNNCYYTGHSTKAITHRVMAFVLVKNNNTFYANSCLCRADLSTNFSAQPATCISLKNFIAVPSDSQVDTGNCWAAIGTKAYNNGSNYESSIKLFKFGVHKSGMSHMTPDDYNFGYQDYTTRWANTFGNTFRVGATAISWDDTGYYLAIGHYPLTYNNSYDIVSVYNIGWNNAQEPTNGGVSKINAPDSTTYKSTWSISVDQHADLVSWRPRGYDFIKQSDPYPFTLDLIIHKINIAFQDPGYSLYGENNCHIIRYNCFTANLSTCIKIGEFQISSGTQLYSSETIQKWSPKTIGWSTHNSLLCQLQNKGHGLEFFIPTCDLSYNEYLGSAALSLYTWPLGIPNVAKAHLPPESLEYTNPQYYLFSGAKNKIGLGVATSLLTRWQPSITIGATVLKLASSVLPGIDDEIRWQNLNFSPITNLWYLEPLRTGTITSFSADRVANVNCAGTNYSINLDQTPYIKTSTTCTVKFYDGDDLIDTQTNITEGASITFEGTDEPQDSYDHDFRNQYRYSWVGWSTEPNATTATYNQYGAIIVYSSMNLYAVRTLAATTALTYSIKNVPKDTAADAHANFANANTFIKIASDPDTSTYWQNVTSSTNTTSVILSGLNYGDSLMWKTEAQNGYYTTASTTSGTFTLNENTVVNSFPIYFAGLPILYVRVNFENIANHTYSRIAGTYTHTTSEYPLPASISSLTCYRMAWNEANFSELNMSPCPITYGDQFYWAATANTGYNTPTTQYNSDQNYFEFLPNSPGTVLCGVEKAQPSATKNTYTISWISMGTIYGSWTVTGIANPNSGWTKTVEYNDYIMFNTSSITCYDNSLGNIKWTATLTPYQSTAYYDYYATIYRVGETFAGTSGAGFPVTQNYSVSTISSVLPKNQTITLNFDEGISNIYYKTSAVGSYIQVYNINSPAAYSTTVSTIPYNSTIYLYAVAATNYNIRGDFSSDANNPDSLSITGIGPWSWSPQAYSNETMAVNLNSIDYGYYSIQAYNSDGTLNGSPTTAQSATQIAKIGDTINVDWDSTNSKVVIFCIRNDNIPGESPLVRWVARATANVADSQYSYTVGPNTTLMHGAATQTQQHHSIVVDNATIYITPTSTSTLRTYTITATNQLNYISYIAVTFGAEAGLPQENDWVAFSAAGYTWTSTYNNNYRIFLATTGTEADGIFASSNTWIYRGTYNNKSYYEVQSGQLTANITLNNNYSAICPSQQGKVAPQQAPALYNNQTDPRHDLACSIFTISTTVTNPSDTEVTLIIKNPNNFTYALMADFGEGYYKYNWHSNCIYIPANSYWYKTCSISSTYTWDGNYNSADSVANGIAAALRDNHTISLRFGGICSASIGGGTIRYIDFQTYGISPESAYTVTNFVSSAGPHLYAEVGNSGIDNYYLLIRTRNLPSLYSSLSKSIEINSYLKNDPVTPHKIFSSTVPMNNTSSIMPPVTNINDIEYLDVVNNTAYGLNSNHNIITF